MRFTLLTGWTALLCIMSVACVGGRPIHYYTINPTGAATGTSRPDGPAWLIGRIAAPEALQEGRIRYRSGSNEVGAYEYHRWTERPAAMYFQSLRGVKRDVEFVAVFGRDQKRLPHNICEFAS
jgi:hypothetical protein